MSDGAPLPGGRLEYAVLVALWEAQDQALSAREVHQRVGLPLHLVYTTTARVLDRLQAKGLVAREKTGRVFVYRARTERPVIDRARIVKTLTGLIGAEPRPALATLVEAVESIDPALLDHLALAIDARRRSRHEP
jgi:predicted transcriptional regulator